MLSQILYCHPPVKMTNPDHLPHSPRLDRKWIADTQVILSDLEWAISASDFEKLAQITAKGRRQNRAYRELLAALVLTGQSGSRDY
jgi:hypothetical protein